MFIQKKLSKIKNETSIINLHEYESVGAHWIVLHANTENVTGCESSRVIFQIKLENLLEIKIL